MKYSIEFIGYEFHIQTKSLTKGETSCMSTLVINDELIRLYHSYSGKTYEFRGVNNIVFMRTQENGKAGESSMKVSPQKTKRKENLRAKMRSKTTTYFSKL